MMQAKTVCPRGGTESTVQNLTAVTCAVATTTVSHVQYSLQSAHAKPRLKQLPECQAQNKLGKEKTKPSSQPSASSSSLAADTSPQILAKLAKGKRSHKIGQPEEVGNSTHQSAGQKNKRQPVATSPCSRSSVANSTVVKHGSHTSTSKLLSASQMETSTKLITQLPNGLVAQAGKTCSNTDHLSQTVSATGHGNSAKPLTHLPNGLQAHADKSCAKIKNLSQNGTNLQSNLGPEVANGSTSVSTDKTSRKIDVVAGTHLEQNGQVRVSKSSEACSQSSSSMDVSREGRPLNGNSDQNAASATTKGKKARRKGRGKEAMTSVG